jgi:acyl-CoA thioesterase
VSRFERDTAIETVGPGRHRARLDDAWRIALGPNGGYIAAVLLRAIEASVDDPARAPRSLTVHYVSRPRGEDVEIVTTEERAGRSLTTVSARMVQGDRVIAVALAASSRPRRLEHAVVAEGTGFPDVVPFTEAERWRAAEGSPAAAFHRQFDLRWAVPEKPWSGSVVARSAAWIRLAEPAPPDAALLALFADALPPAVFSLARGPEALGPVPTIDLTIHFRAPLPVSGFGADDFVLCHFRTRTIADGFLEEDGEIWTAGGTLLAQSRQLAILA